jgi:hypothetical protein
MMKRGYGSADRRRLPVQRPYHRERNVTVCIGALMHWHYPDEPTSGAAALALSDRMITAGDVEYEPFQQKVAFLAPGIVALVAGDFTVHSQAIKTTNEQLRNRTVIKPFDVANIFGQAIQSVQRKMAEDRFLAPLGLNTDSFLAQQKDMSEPFIASVTAQLQDHDGADVEALIVGITRDEAHIYEVDRRGTVRCYDDVGFAAIGIGGWHARSRLMQYGYVNSLGYGRALAATYAAKKAAEVAPGVGKFTDLNLITRDGVTPVSEELANRLFQLYEKYEEGVKGLQEDMINALIKPVHEQDEKAQEPEQPA